MVHLGGWGGSVSDSWFWCSLSLSQKKKKKKRRDRTQINKIRNEGEEITIHITEIQRIIREYYEKLCANRLDNLEERDEFLEIYNLPKLRQKEIENLNRQITSN